VSAGLDAEDIAALVAEKTEMRETTRKRIKALSQLTATVKRRSERQQRLFDYVDMASQLMNASPELQREVHAAFGTQVKVQSRKPLKIAVKFDLPIGLTVDSFVASSTSGTRTPSRRRARAG
jgi:hypothetical protein